MGRKGQNLLVRGDLMPKWNVKEGTAQYEAAAKSLLICLDRANRFLTLNRDRCGLFAGQKGKKKRLKQQERLRRKGIR